MMAMSMLDTLQPVEGMGPVGEVRIVPDPATFVALPYAPGAGAMNADLVRLDGEPWEACARTFLKQAVAELAAEGSRCPPRSSPSSPSAAASPAPAGGPDRLVPIDDSLCYSATGFHLAHDYAIDLVHALQAQGLQVEHYYPELGHGQQEMSIRHAPALRAADNHVIYRETVRGVALRHGLWASLAPKPIPDQAGNGAHLHASLWDLARSPVPHPGQPGTRNLFHAAGDPYGLSDDRVPLHRRPARPPARPDGADLREREQLPRLAPQTWASAYTVYGMDNREAAIRICSPMRGNPAGSVNLELKPSDSSANPYLALGAYIHAGLDGIRSKLDPGEAVNTDPATMTDTERLRAGAHRLPESLNAALNALEADELLMEALGPLRRRAYLAVKRAEAAAFAAQSVDYECFHHFTKF